MRGSFHAGVLSALLVSSTSGAVFANDSSFGGAGADLVPLAQNAVAMVAEDIVLTYADGRFDVSAHYSFENPSKEAVRVQVGFPEYRCPAESEGDCANAPFRDLSTEVDGRAVTHRQGRLRPDQAWAPYLGVVWLFDVTFAPGKRTEIEHHYSLAAGTNVSFEHFTTYVTRTGAVWAGKIGSARFTFVLPAGTHSVIRQFPQPKLVQRGGQDAVEVVLEKHDWEPKEDLFFSFSDFALDYPMPKDGLTEKERCPGLYGIREAEHVQACKNAIYAVAGYRFQRDELNRYFYRGDHGFALAPSSVDPAERVWRRALEPVTAFLLNRIDGASLRVLEDRRQYLGLPKSNEASHDPSSANGVAPASGATPAKGSSVAVAPTLPSSSGTAESGALPAEPGSRSETSSPTPPRETRTGFCSFARTSARSSAPALLFAALALGAAARRKSMGKRFRP